MHWASIGWILPELHDPDGHEVRFYTHQHHTKLEPDAITVINDPRERSERHERAVAGNRKTLLLPAEVVAEGLAVRGSAQGGGDPVPGPVRGTSAVTARQ